MANTVHGRTAWMRAFIFLIAWLTVAGWGLSWLHKLEWQEWTGLAGEPFRYDESKAVWIACFECASRRR